MTEKDFDAIAAVVEGLWAIADNVCECGMIVGIAHDLADVFAESNERFDRARFLKACRVSR